jgi:hypothetical protein
MLDNLQKMIDKPIQ